MKLFPARNLAEKIVAQLAPLCEKIEIAGSIRRGRPEVGDIDLVVLPKPGEMPAIKERCLRQCRAITNGDQNFIVALRLPDKSEFQLDIWFARAQQKDLLQTLPGNWGSILLCRTGSREHNIYLAEEAKKLGLSWKTYDGIFDSDGYCIASETEEDIFKALGKEWLAPAYREGRGAPVTS